MNETNQGGDGSCVYEGIVVASVVCFLVCVCVCVCVCVARPLLGFKGGWIHEFVLPLHHRQFRVRNGTRNNTHFLLHYAEPWLSQVLLERSKSRRPNGASLLEDNVTKSGESAYSMHENA